MNWTDQTKPTVGIPYDHVLCQTPLGIALIEWKGWKNNDTYSLSIGGDYIGESDTLEDAKERARQYLIGKSEELSSFLAQ